MASFLKGRKKVSPQAAIPAENCSYFAGILHILRLFAAFLIILVCK
jgi:hypothetical protein